MDNEDALWLGGGSRARDSSFLSEDVVFKMERWNLGGAE